MSEKTDFWLSIVKAYCDETAATEYVIHDVVVWAKDNGRWEPSLEQVTKVGVAQCRAALRTAEETLPSGATMRQYISARIEQKDLWANVRDASHEFVLTHVRQQAQRVVADVQALRQFVDNYNRFLLQPGRQPVQLDFDWNQDDAA